MNPIVGVLALQGAYQKHIDCLNRIGIQSTIIRQPSEIKNCSALILPGGESTTISLLLQKTDLYEAIVCFAKTHPVMGVCAGMILMADEVDDDRIIPLRLIPFKASRNYYGRQAQSFSADIKLNFDDKPFHALFIRAPAIEKLSPEVKILATHNKEVVMISKDKHIALSFHPELSHDTRIHQYWLSHFL